jgi:methylated-DNA-[protein]-cysteine S-methyltransferase
MTNKAARPVRWKPADSGTDLAAAVMETPIGPLRLLASDAGLVGIYFGAEVGAEGEVGPSIRPLQRQMLEHATRELAEYFRGERTTFTTPLVESGTAFQREVWRALGEIPFGARSGYAALATKIGRPRAQRAVGAANRCNPHSIIVPCHRVIGADGSLTGYAGGLPTKEWLLAHEARVLGQQRAA